MMSNETDNVSFVSALTYNELAEIRIRARGDLSFDKKRASPPNSEQGYN